ncbi:MAG: hypothetical protein LC776_06385 [Acidobacteria bacterium]|nr:hypothetical protein [Acidobacteriota bacterium]
MANESGTAYLCPEGYLRTDKPGTCPEHGVELQEAKYRCPSCGYAALEPDVCPHCKTEMKEI